MSNEALKITFFCCSNSFDREELTGYFNGLDASMFKVISLPCSGKADVPYLVKAFEKGADGVVILTCKENECQRLEGNMRAQRRASAVTSLLEEIGVDPCRMTVITPKTDGSAEVSKGIQEFYSKIKALPILPA